MRTSLVNIMDEEHVEEEEDKDEENTEDVIVSVEVMKECEVDVIEPDVEMKLE